MQMTIPTYRQLCRHQRQFCRRFFDQAKSDRIDGAEYTIISVNTEGVRYSQNYLPPRILSKVDNYRCFSHEFRFVLNSICLNHLKSLKCLALISKEEAMEICEAFDSKLMLPLNIEGRNSHLKFL